MLAHPFTQASYPVLVHRHSPASFTPAIACSKLAAFYGLETLLSPLGDFHSRNPGTPVARSGFYLYFSVFPRPFSKCALHAHAGRTDAGIVHLADSANFKAVITNKLCSGLSGLCFESPNDTIHVTVVRKPSRAVYFIYLPSLAG